MLQAVVVEYDARTPRGYPSILDATERGTVGLQLDPSHALYFVSDGEQIYVDFYYRSSRIDARTSGGWEKFSGLPVDQRRVVNPDATVLELRNLISELLHRYNYQPGLIHMTDT
jgi:hypothetical protein